MPRYQTSPEVARISGILTVGDFRMFVGVALQQNQQSRMRINQRRERLRIGKQTHRQCGQTGFGGEMVILNAPVIQACGAANPAKPVSGSLCVSMAWPCSASPAPPVPQRLRASSISRRAAPPNVGSHAPAKGSHKPNINVDKLAVSVAAFGENH